jgi:hypothetical protein
MTAFAIVDEGGEGAVDVVEVHNKTCKDILDN